MKKETIDSVGRMLNGMRAAIVIAFVSILAAAVMTHPIFIIVACISGIIAGFIAIELAGIFIGEIAEQRTRTRKKKVKA